MNKKLIKETIRRMGYYSKPDFLIIGAQKAGTSGLYRILIQHSKIIGSSKKEIHYFDTDEWYLKNRKDKYHSYFPLPHNITKEHSLFEATPSYLYHPKAAERIYKYNPKMKLIVLLRDPSVRALSAWSMYHYKFKKGKNKNLYEPRSFPEAISQELENIESNGYYRDKKGYVIRGIYYNQIERYQKYFLKDQILFIEDTQLLYDFEQSMKIIFSFLNIEQEKVYLKVKNKRKVNNNAMYKETIQTLKNFYKFHNEKLYKLIGEKYNWNN